MVAFDRHPEAKPKDLVDASKRRPIACVFYFSCEQFVIDAITICPADSFKKPAVQITVGLVKFLGMKNVQIATGDNEGKNPFPDKWRGDSDSKIADSSQEKISVILEGKSEGRTKPDEHGTPVTFVKDPKAEMLNVLILNAFKI